MLSGIMLSVSMLSATILVVGIPVVVILWVITQHVITQIAVIINVVAPSKRPRPSLKVFHFISKFYILMERILASHYCAGAQRVKLFWRNGTVRFFAFSLIIEGTTEKVLKFIMPLKSIYYRNFGFTEQKMYF
jgi:hypothetical protein